MVIRVLGFLAVIIVALVVIGGASVFNTQEKEQANVLSTEKEEISEEIVEKKESDAIYKHPISIGGVSLLVDVANTESKREQGLSGREQLLANQGMLFVFSNSSKYGFWMKDMKFAIDMIWIDENFKVVDVAKNATPESYPGVFYPSSEALFVLETESGFVEKHRIKSGDEVKGLDF